MLLISMFVSYVSLLTKIAKTDGGKKKKKKERKKLNKVFSIKCL